MRSRGGGSGRPPGAIREGAQHREQLRPALDLAMTTSPRSGPSVVVGSARREMSRGSSRSKVVVEPGQVRAISRASVVLPIWRGPRMATTERARNRVLTSRSSVARPNTRERYHEMLASIDRISW